MKNKILDYVLLNRLVYKKPVRKRFMLFMLGTGAGIVYMLGYSVTSGWGFFSNIFTVIMAVVLILFTGIFSAVIFCWPIADLMVVISEGLEKFNFPVKRLKLVKGFFYAVIYTGTVAGFVKILAFGFMELENAVLVSTLASVLASVWAGAMVTRCIISVFEETAKKKKLILAISAIWYYLIVVQIIGFIIKIAYSIIL
ncbi:MAG: hypothetical protein JXB33_05440 [Clostridia bacterium]|nr:hypothetical protein [Clostridia bacterium]